MGDIVYADTSEVSDRGDLDYQFTNYAWFYQVPFDDYEVILQQGPSNRYVVTDAVSGEALQVRADFRNPDFGYTGQLQATTEPVATLPEETVRIARFWLSPVNGTPSDGIYGCGDDLRVRIQLTGDLPYEDKARAVARLRIGIGPNERTMIKISLPKYAPGEPTPIAESPTSFEFGYIVHHDDRGSSVQIREIFTEPDSGRPARPWPENFDPSFVAITLPTTIDGSRPSVDQSADPPECPGTTTNTAGPPDTSTTTRSVEPPAPTSTTTKETQSRAPSGFTARFVGMPAEHTGHAFTFETAFNQIPDTTKNGWVRSAFEASGGAITRVRKIDGDAQRRIITATPAGSEPMTISLVPARSCADAKALCTASGGKLLSPISAKVQGPVQLQVADTQTHEGVNATLDFAVTLHRAATTRIDGYFTTRDGTARAGEDYVTRSGTFTFQPGQTRQTISVTVLDDTVDDDGETVLLEVLVNSSYGIVVADGQGVGTIHNSDPMPKAWIARFGRTVASQAVRTISERGKPRQGSHLTVAGHRMSAFDTDFNRPIDHYRHTAEQRSAEGEPVKTLDSHAVLGNLAFELSGDDPSRSTGWSAWGRSTQTAFDGSAGTVDLHGRVRTLFVGADLELGTVDAGLALGLSTGSGSFSSPDRASTGTVDSTLNVLYPYAHMTIDDATSVWILGGLGRGELTLRPGGTKSKRETDLGMHLGAIGGERILTPTNGPDALQLTANADALWLRTGSDETPELRAATANVSRVRAALKATRANRFEGGTFTPGLELGLRHDCGDAERGLGLEAGVSGVYQREPLQISAEARLLAAHQRDDYEEWSASATIQIAPRAGGTGLSLRLQPQIGAGAAQPDALWSLNPGTSGNSYPVEPAGKLAMDLGYGARWPGYPGVFTPYIGANLHSDSATAARLGLGWQFKDDQTVRLQGSRRENGSHAITIEARLRF